MTRRLLQARAIGTASTAGLMAVLLLAVVPGLRAQGRFSAVTAVPKLDETRLLGTWYEQASLPFKREKRCVSNSIELIAPGGKPNQLQLVDACDTKQGYTDARNTSADAADKHGDGEFKVRTWVLFWRKYWVLALGPDYEWALIGSPNRKTLWVFSKARRLSPEVLAEIEAKGTAEGFVSSRLVAHP